MSFRKYSVSLFFLILTAIGIALLVMGGNANAKAANWDEVQATITDIQHQDQSYYVAVEYTYKGTEYDNHLDGYSSSMHVGDKVTIAVNPNNPMDISWKAGNTTLLKLGFFITATGFMISSLSAVYITLKSL